MELNKKRKQLREGIARQQITMPSGLPKQFVGTDLADRILEYLHSAGCVLRQFSHSVELGGGDKAISYTIEPLIEDTAKLAREKK